MYGLRYQCLKLAVVAFVLVILKHVELPCVIAKVKEVT